MKEDEAYIYSYTNKLNGKVYIGSRYNYNGKAEDDFNIKYFSSSKDNEFRKAFLNNELEGLILMIFYKEDWKENVGKIALKYEYELILKFWNKYGKDLSYNHRAGLKNWNTVGHKDTEDTRNKKSIGHKGLIIAEETKKKISSANKGKKRSENTKNKISLLKLGNKYWAGKHHNKETKKKISEAHKGNHYGKGIKKKKRNFINNEGDIVAMTLSNAKRWHPDWKLLK